MEHQGTNVAYRNRQPNKSCSASCRHLVVVAYFSPDNTRPRSVWRSLDKRWCWRVCPLVRNVRYWHLRRCRNQDCAMHHAEGCILSIRWRRVAACWAVECQSRAPYPLPFWLSLHLYKRSLPPHSSSASTSTPLATSSPTCIIKLGLPASPALYKVLFLAR